MREEQHERGGVGAEEGTPEAAGALVVLTSGFGVTARTSTWICGKVEGLELVAIPRLHIEHEAALALTTGRGLADIFQETTLRAPGWEDIGAIIGGSWQIWRTSRPELTVAGFVRGTREVDIERAVRGLRKLLT